MALVEDSKNLSGSSRAKRLAAIDVFTQNGAIDLDLASILKSIENVPSTITDYRDRERHLESLLKVVNQDDISGSRKKQVVIIRYLLGSLYVNFEKFWGPTIRVINEILVLSKFRDELLEIIIGHLQDTTDTIYNGCGDIDNTEDRPDHVLHRNFIFQLLYKFASHVQSNSETFVEQFLIFVQKELQVSPFLERNTRCDLSQSDPKMDENLDMTGAHSVTNDDTECANRGCKKTKKYSSATLIRKQKSRETFLTASKIFQSFSDMMKIHRQEDLKSLFLELLCCRDPSVQKAAFNCILAYEDEFLKPYTDNLMKIMNDKMVRTELLFFSIEEDESDKVQDSHRSGLMPVLLRILFGKMIGKIGRRTSGRDKANLRKTLIMRFIAGCSTDEMLIFFELLFDPIFMHTSSNYDCLTSDLSKNLDITDYIPLSKLQAMIDSMFVFIDSVAHLNGDTLQYLLKLMNILVYYIVSPLVDQDIASRIKGKNINLLKSLRRECLNLMSKFFHTFEYYPFTQGEIDFIFRHLVWTSTSGFVDRNYSTATPLLKFIGTLSENRVYHRLLVKRNKNNLDEFLLNHLIILYSDVKTTRPILKLLASFFADILDQDRNSRNDIEDEPMEARFRLPPIEDKNAIIPEYPKTLYKVMDQPEYGAEILMNFIPVIFDRLKKNCQEFVEKKVPEYRIENDELFVLSTLSTYIKDSKQSLLATCLLLSTIEHQRKEELILNTLKTCQDLIKQVDTVVDSTLIPLIANILSYQRNYDQRRELCGLLMTVSQIEPNLKEVYVVVKLMNETTQDTIDCPDLVKWNEGFQLAFALIESLDQDKINNIQKLEDTLTLLIHQVFFIMNNVDKYEFSIRDNCQIFSEKLAQSLSLVDRESNSKFLRRLLDDILLEKYIKKGLRDTNDVIKHAYIGTLRSFALECHDKNVTLKEISLFCSSEPDLDFWLNIRHIQLHNRSKALARLIANPDIEKVSPKTLSSYFMPIAAGFLFSKAYKSLASLAENSIKLIGLICKHLNWMTYKSTLNYYLDLLTKANTTYQRTNIKLITEILRNFNFDITACKEAMDIVVENTKLQKRMMNRKGSGANTDSSGAIATDAPSGKKLNASTARMVYFSVTKQILPRLNSCLHEMTRVEFEHDKNMFGYLPEKEEIKRIPIAFAIVQLLNLLPGRYVLFRDNLPTLFIKLSSFLKSKNEQVRKVARATLVKIMAFIGPAYVPDLLRVLKQNLEKGFQIHVLNYTVHSVMEKLPLYYGSLDHSVESLTDSCFKEIFGRLAEDKEVSQILAKTFEAKKTKSYDTLLILSSHISAEKLPYLMNSVSEMLKTSNEPRKVNKLSVCVQKIFTGLTKNNQFPLEKILHFLQSTIEESIPSLKIRQRVEKAEVQFTKPLREDRFLIRKEIPRSRLKSKINEKGNLHMVIENCLRLLLHVLKKNNSMLKKRESVNRKLDGLIKLLATCLKSSSPKCVMRSLKCIYFITRTKSDLPSFKTKCNLIVRRIFILLSLYNGVGMVQGDNFEMIAMCFKTVAVLLLRCDHVQLDAKQLRALLVYIEQDLHDQSRQVTALGTLRSLLKKGCDSPELGEIMVKVGDILVTSDDESVRTLLIKIWQIYLLDYNHEGKSLQAHLTKFLRQLDYEFIDGRKSIIGIINIVITKFPDALLREYFELMFHLMSQRIVNEESKELRTLVSRSIGLLIQRFPDLNSFMLNKLVLQWASASATPLRLLGVKLLRIFLQYSENSFNDKSRLRKVISIISDILDFEINHNGLESQNTIDNQDMNTSGDQVIDAHNIINPEDKLRYQTQSLLKMLFEKGIVSPVETRYIDSFKKIWLNLSAKGLCNHYLPVVISASELYLIFIKNTNIAKSLAVKKPNTENYLDWNAKNIVRTLCDRHLVLLDRAEESHKLLGLLTETMILIGRILANCPATLDFEDKYMKSFDGADLIDHLIESEDLPDEGFLSDHTPYSLIESKKRVDLAWLSVKIVMQARKEAALFRLSNSYRRRFVLQWTAAISQELGNKRISSYALLFMMVPARELTDKGGKMENSDKSEQQNTLAMSEDLLKFLKSLIGVQRFNKLYSKVQLHYTRRRLDRKKKAAILKVRDQTRGVKRKISLNKSKSTKRKRSKMAARNVIKNY